MCTIFYKRLDSVKDSSSVEEIRVDFLGKKGKVIEILKNLKSVEIEDKLYITLIRMFSGQCDYS